MLKARERISSPGRASFPVSVSPKMIFLNCGAPRTELFRFNKAHEYRRALDDSPCAGILPKRASGFEGRMRSSKERKKKEKRTEKNKETKDATHPQNRKHAG